METFNQDPKPGRLVLPLVLIGMIATTYTFVNRVATNNDLDVSVVEEEATTEEEATEDTTTTSSTTEMSRSLFVATLFTNVYVVAIIPIRTSGNTSLPGFGS